MKPTTVLTGATGFIGRASLAPLAEKFTVLALCRQIPDTKISGVDYFELDLEDQTAIADFFQKHTPTHLVHTAWARAGSAGLWHSPQNAHWVDLSENLVKSFQKAGGLRALVCGTCAEYATADAPLKEDESVIAPDSAYGTAKVELHGRLRTLATKTGISLIWPRLFFLYGPGENENRLVPSIIGNLLNGQRTPCTHGKQIRDYTYVGDVGEGITRLLAGSFDGAINLASGREITLRDLVYKIGSLLNRDNLIDLGALQARPGEAQYIVADIQKLERELAWSPPTRLDTGLRAMIEFEKQKWGGGAFNELG